MARALGRAMERADDRLVLAVDTSTRDLSLALAEGEGVRAELGISEAAQHSRTLFGHIDYLLGASGVVAADIDLFAAIDGPGSFTGLRVGIAAIKGLAGATGRPAIGVSAFDAWAMASGAEGLVAVLISGGRGDLYCGLRRVDRDGAIVIEGSDWLGERSKVIESLIGGYSSERMVIVGLEWGEDGDETAGIIEDAMRGEGWRIERRREFLAPAAALLAARRLEMGDLEPLRPRYLKASDAELKSGRSR